ncbi:MAG: DMT family transporter [Armatimonadota bacterium]|nr:DMT family transporter [Armatimonadota bacterium]MDR7534998.1 DMT family transporter [Armatimonadota bacterium]
MAPAAPARTGRPFGLGDVFALTTVVLWGASFAVIKSAYDELTPLAFAAVRFVLASAALALVVAALRQPLRVARGDVPRTVVVGLCHVGLYQIFFGLGLKDTTASNSVLIINTSPVITTLLVWATGAERLTGRQVAGIGLAALGVAVLVDASGHLSRLHLRGDLLTLLAAWSYGVTPVMIFPLYRRYSTLTVMAVSMSAGTVLLLLAGAPELARQSWALSPAAWSALLYAALGAGTLGYLCWYEGIRRLGPTRATAYSYLMPVVGVVAAVLGLRESFGLQQLAGAVVILAGVALARWPAPHR